MNCHYCKNAICENREPCECRKYDIMTEEETDKYWTDGEEGCPYYENYI